MLHKKCKVTRHIQPPLQQIPIPIPLRRFDHIHIDLVGPLPPSDNFSYLLIIVDRSTRWPEAIPLKSITASSCAKALINGWISRFGVPSKMTSDRGAQFTSSVWSSLCTFLGIQKSLTASFHYESNGMVEKPEKFFESKNGNQLLVSGVALGFDRHQICSLRC